MELFSGINSPEMLEYLQKRRSVVAQNMTEPAPSKDEMDSILRAAARVPDHGKLNPWYFIVFDGQSRVDIGVKIAELYPQENPDFKPAHIEVERERFTRAPMVVGVVSRIRNGKPPQWEQVLSAGAACMNLVLAANAAGYGAQWLSEWYSYNDDFKSYLGLDARDHIAGFIHIGTIKDKELIEERPRPDMNEIVTYWNGNASDVKKGDQYNVAKFPIPKHGFKLPNV